MNTWNFSNKNIRRNIIGEKAINWTKKECDDYIEALDKKIGIKKTIKKTIKKIDMEQIKRDIAMEIAIEKEERMFGIK